MRQTSIKRTVDRNRKQQSTVVARAVHANRGIEARYRKRLQSLIDEMSNSVLYWATAAYNKTPPTLAEDASPLRDIAKQLQKVAKQWADRFNKEAPKIAEMYVTELFKATDSSFRQALKDVGFTVKFQLTPAMRDAFDAAVIENVSLIKSIPAEYLQKVEGAVMRGYTVGRDLAKIRKSIERIYPVTSNRAVLIARDQSNKANAVVLRTRQLELGITEAIWMHSSGGKEPRPDHVAANGKKFKVEQGCLISGEYIYPGQKINCRCTSRAVIPGLAG